MANPEEIACKESRVREMMARECIDALAMSSIGNFAWATCGGQNHVGIGAENGVAWVVFTRDAKYVVADNIEARRIAEEEVEGQGFEVRSCPWHTGGVARLVEEIAAGGVLASDAPLPGSSPAASLINPLRQSLTVHEVERYRELGNAVGESVAGACREIGPGMTEHEIGSVMGGKLLARGISPLVTLIAVDERIGLFRHPVPTAKRLDKLAMLVTGGRRGGLIISTTRLVHFGPLPDDLRRRHDAVTMCDAAVIAASVPGARTGDVFDALIATYRATGYPEDWRLHHQGGPTGYKGREFRVNSATDALIVENQAFAWNPSITGTKSEDTILATSNGPETLSCVRDWPEVEIDCGGVRLKRPDILVR